MTELPGKNQYLPQQAMFGYSQSNQDKQKPGWHPQWSKSPQPPQAWGLLQLGSPSKEKSLKFMSQKKFRSLLNWQTEHYFSVCIFGCNVHEHVYFIFHAEMINHLTCQTQWKVDVIGFFWLHHAEITEAVSVHRWCFFTQSGLSHQLPSSLLYFILIKSPNRSFTIPKPSTKALGSFMFLSSLLCFYLPHTSVTTLSHWKPQFPSFKKKKNVYLVSFFFFLEIFFLILFYF